jgi:hypothetical protein
MICHPFRMWMLDFKSRMFAKFEHVITGKRLDIDRRIMARRMRGEEINLRPFWVNSNVEILCYPGLNITMIIVIVVFFEILLFSSLKQKGDDE